MKIKRKHEWFHFTHGFCFHYFVWNSIVIKYHWESLPCDRGSRLFHVLASFLLVDRPQDFHRLIPMKRLYLHQLSNHLAEFQHQHKQLVLRIHKTWRKNQYFVTTFKIFTFLWRKTHAKIPFPIVDGNRNTTNWN